MCVHPYYWGWDLIGGLLSRGFPPTDGFWNLESVFDSLSTTRSMIMTFSWIVFMFEGDEKSFREDYVPIRVLSLRFTQGWLLYVKGQRHHHRSKTLSLFLFNSDILWSVEYRSSDIENNGTWLTFIEVLSKDFESYPLEDLQGWLLNNTGVT